MPSKSRTCIGCGAVQPSPRSLERGYCEECGRALQYLSRAELKQHYPHLWDHLFDLAKRHVGDTGGYVREDGVIVTVQEIRAAAAGEMRERCADLVETYDVEDNCAFGPLKQEVAAAIRAVPAVPGAPEGGGA